jgi:SAM-dependent methyltransferase
VDKPYSAACARNQDVILDVLRDRFVHSTRVLEIGSGTGQHAVHFAPALPHLVWQTSDVPAHLGGIVQWLAEALLPNTPEPLSFDINGAPPAATFDAIFSANTLHIMSWLEVQRLFALLPGLMSEGALLVVYGPFNYGGGFTSPSNAAFDATLRAGDPQRGIRDFEAVDDLANTAGLNLIEDRAMPANNRCLTWQRVRQAPVHGSHGPQSGL